MKQIVVFLSLFLCSSPLNAQTTSVERPKLIVGIVVDQMRWDYLYRFYDLYGNNGFKKLIGQGFSCDHTMINYLPAFTAPGHSCIYTGSVPSIHGIAGNDWIDNMTGKVWYCTDDSSVTSVGGGKAGLMSPRNLLTTTVTDELRLATNFKSRVFGISLKDRASILPAGHLANGAFWFDDSNGNFITSSYYENTLPQWLIDFNNRHLPDSLLSKPWKPLRDINEYGQSLPDDNSYEGNFSGEGRPVFPHIKNKQTGYSALRKIPSGNSYTLQAAKACIEGEHLGGSTTDFLCISLSSTDYIGHQFAPNSIEVEDTYLRLDQDLAMFLTYLDNKVGKGNYLLFLTADHGGAHNAAYLTDIKVPAGNDPEKSLSEGLKAYLRKEFGNDSLVRGIENYQVFLNNDAIQRQHINSNELKDKIIDWLYQRPQIAYVIDMERMDRTAVPEPVKTMAINGYNRLRSGSLLIINNPGWYYGYGHTGTTHGTWHPYDAHIPLVWYGWKVPKGKTNRMVHMEDIAPTVSALLHIQMPNGCIGSVITELAK